MKHFFYLLIALLMGANFTACTNDIIADTEGLYETQATEGEDGGVDQDPEEDEPVGGN